MALEEYRKKRKFQETPEPPPETPAAKPAEGPTFVVQKHDATRLHYDVRLEIGGALVSWAVPKGPSLNPADKRLAMMTEDHPMEYAGFEGVIPEGNYGAGPVMVWDNGTYTLEGRGTAAEQLARGDLKFSLRGRKLHGSFVLVRTKSKDLKLEGKQWLMIKHRDEHVDPSWDIDRYDWSVLTGRSLREIEQGLPAHAGSPGELEGARKAAMPAEIEPMLASLVAAPFSDPAWIFELKWDGMRLLARIANGKCELRSRRGRDVTPEFPELGELAQRVAAEEAILDGEAVVLDKAGRPDFGRMQQRMNNTRPSRALLEEAPVVFYAFDILYADGYDLRAAPLVERKEFLRRVLSAQPPVRFSDHVAERGEDLFKLARERGLEGIIGKHAQSKYTPGRSANWVKVKTARELDAVVGGWTAPRGSQHFGALLLGLHEDSRLRFIGAVGTGFDQKTQAEIWRLLQPHASEEPPFESPPLTREQAWWTRPALVARVKYSEFTHEGHLRAPVFLGLRPDMDPRECRLEVAEAKAAPAPEVEPSEAAVDVERELCRGTSETITIDLGGRRLKFSNLGKIYFPEDGYTKRDLLCHYVRVAEYILPFLRNRPMVLRRMPDGIQGQLFYQKEAGEYAPDWMPTHPIYSEDVRKTISYFVCNDTAGLLYLTNLGCIDHDPWSSQIGDLEKPDWAFFDLDPTDNTDFDVVLEVAREVNRVLTAIGMRPFLKMSGASGFHIFVPVECAYSYAQVRAFAEIVSRVVHGRMPDQTTLERVVDKRPHGRVYLDYNQLAWGKPLASVYSVRPVPGACVSAPVAANELRRGLRPQRFTIKTMPARLKKTGDRWADFWKSRQRLEPALEKLRSEV